MSRIGKQVIEIPEPVEIHKNETNQVSVKGPQGTLERSFKPEVEIVVEGRTVRFVPRDNSVRTRALWGTYASHISNMIQGVVKPYQKRLIIEGVGYKAEVQGQELVLTVGFSHPVRLTILDGLKVTAEKNLVSIEGVDKELVGLFAGRVRLVKRVEPYKGKGIRYEDEVIRRKEGKKSA